MASLLRDILRTGLVSGVVSGAAALAFSRVRNRRAAPAMNAVSHIAWGGEPPAETGPGGRNFVVGSALHLGAATFWAAFFEILFGAAARGSQAAAWTSGSGVAACAFLTDYLIVPRRLRPGMEVFLSRRALVGVYAVLGAGFALAARTHPAARRGPAPALGVAASGRHGAVQATHDSAGNANPGVRVA